MEKIQLSRLHLSSFLFLVSLPWWNLPLAEAQFKQEHQGYLILRDVGAEARAKDGNKRYSEKYKIRQVDTLAGDKIIITAQDKRGRDKVCELPIAQLGVRRPMISRSGGGLCPDGVSQRVDPHLGIMLLVFEDLPNYLNYEITCDMAQGGEVIGYSLMAVPCSPQRIEDCPDRVPRELFRYASTWNKDSYPLPPLPQESALAGFSDQLGRILFFLATSGAARGF